jgi:hypothetical protein
MKHYILASLMIVAAILFCNNSNAQPIHKTLVVSINGVDYGGGIGVVNGTYTYHFMYKLNNDGFIERVHWNVKDINLVNDKGEKVKVIDSGLDTYGVFWDFWNNPNAYNAAGGYPITYNVTDGWLDGVIPDPLPPQGVLVNMSCKIQVKNEKYRVGMLWIVNFNANGDPVVDFVKVK